jgi:hypothetical protein
LFNKLRRSVSTHRFCQPSHLHLTRRIDDRNLIALENRVDYGSMCGHPVIECILPLLFAVTLLHLSAKLIEKCIFLQYFQRGNVLRFHARPEFVNLQHDGALALAIDATVIAADEMALRLLGVPSPVPTKRS